MYSEIFTWCVLVRLQARKKRFEAFIDSIERMRALKQLCHLLNSSVHAANVADGPSALRLHQQRQRDEILAGTKHFFRRLGRRSLKNWENGPSVWWPKRRPNVSIVRIGHDLTLMRRRKNTKYTGVDETHTCIIRKRNKNLQTRAENAEQESESLVTSRNRLPHRLSITWGLCTVWSWGGSES